MSNLQSQWIELKKEAKGNVIAVSLGDYYEFFFEDAEYVSELFNLKISWRNSVPMVGIRKNDLFDIYYSKFNAPIYIFELVSDLNLNPKWEVCHFIDNNN